MLEITGLLPNRVTLSFKQMSGPLRCPLLRAILMFAFATRLCLPATADPVAVDSVTAVARELHRIEFLIPETHQAQLNPIPRTQITGPGASFKWREKVPLVIPSTFG